MSRGRSLDTPVVRGYLDRQVKGEDRRRMDIELAERGRAAASVALAAVTHVDRQLTAMLSAASSRGCGRVGGALGSEIRKDTEHDRDSDET